MIYKAEKDHCQVFPAADGRGRRRGANQRNPRASGAQPLQSGAGDAGQAELRSRPAPMQPVWREVEGGYVH